MGNGFGLNTNLFETNVLNLSVVIGVVVVVVGDSLSSLLEQRRKTILSTLQEADAKAIEAKNQLDAARKSVETAQIRAREIRLQAVQIAEKESSEVRRQSKSDIVRLQESAQQAVQLERQRATKAISRKVIDLALATTETVLLKTFGSKNSSRSKHKELNEIHIRETFRKLTKA